MGCFGNGNGGLPTRHTRLPSNSPELPTFLPNLFCNVPKILSGPSFWSPDNCLIGSLVPPLYSPASTMFPPRRQVNTCMSY
ncbi:Uncharacterized protein APZ42_031167 [Daphnia magna]|uniref:Uncharacterized protein n=1 Tax=Daphnia magna TaxID=35525 RepID=A0A164N498_9CRUS|nr:Uncharacterized protein APZ42_031167 [Daphnia magna]